MYKKYLNAVFILGLVSLLLLLSMFIVFLWKEENRLFLMCEDKGGTVVKVGGDYKCVKLREIE